MPVLIVKSVAVVERTAVALLRHVLNEVGITAIPT